MKNGFTLLETLVGVLILGFLLVGLAGGARFGAGAAIRQGKLSDRSGDLDAVDRTLRQIVATADPAATLVGTAGTLSLVADIPNAPGPKTIALGLEAGHRLVLRWTAKPPGRPLVPLAPQEAELLSGIAGITLSYYGAATDTDPGRMAARVESQRATDADPPADRVHRPGRRALARHRHGATA